MGLFNEKLQLASPLNKKSRWTLIQLFQFKGAVHYPVRDIGVNCNPNLQWLMLPKWEERLEMIMGNMAFNTNNQMSEGLFLESSEWEETILTQHLTKLNKSALFSLIMSVSLSRTHTRMHAHKHTRPKPPSPRHPTYPLLSPHIDLHHKGPCSRFQPLFFFNFPIHSTRCFIGVCRR